MVRSGAERQVLWNAERITISFLIGLLLLSWALRLHGLDANGLWQDEIFTAAIASAQNSLSEVVSIPLYNTALPAPALYFLLTHAFLHIGDNDFLLRFPPLAFGMLGVAVTYVLGTRLFGAREGLAGAFLLAIAPLHIRYSQDARFYTLLVFLSLLSLYSLYRAIYDGERRWWAGFALCSVLNVYNHLFGFLVLLAEVVFVAGLWVAEALLRRRTVSSAGEEVDARAPERTPDRQGVVAFVVSLAIVALAYTPMIPHLLRGLSGAKGLGATTRGVGYITSVVGQAVDSWGLGSGWAILILMVPFLIGIVASAKQQWRLLWLAFCWLVLPFAVLYAFPAGHGFRPRYVLFMLPLYLLIVAKGLTSVDEFIAGRLAGGRARRSNISLAVLLAGITILSVPAVQAYYEEDRANWRAVASLLARSISPEDRVVSPGPFPQVVLPRYEDVLEEATYVIGGSDVFLGAEQESHAGVWFVGPAREKMRAIDEELTEAVGLFFKVALEVDDQTAARGRALKLAPVMYDDLWVLYVSDGLEPEEVAELHDAALEVVPPSTASSSHVALGEFHRANDDFEQAMLHYRQAAILDPSAPEPHYGLALVYRAQGMQEQYESEWETYKELAAQQ
jgi:mannosyltransferase